MKPMKLSAIKHNLIRFNDHSTPSLFWFRGHFAVQPLLPGVAQIDWVMHYATTYRARLAFS